MSSLKVEVVIIDEILPHPNADRLEIARIAGWNCVVRKGEYKAGDKVVYIPIDSVLPIDLESSLFPPESKVKLDKSRVKTIKLRKVISQGIIVSPTELVPWIGPGHKLKVGDDVAGLLKITKYEPPSSSTPGLLRGGRLSPRLGNHNFRKYTDIENYKHYNELFTTGELVWVSEKLHGTSARYGCLPTTPNTVWKKIKKFFGLLPKYEFCLGSRNVQLQDKRRWDGFYDTNVYAKIAKQEDLYHKLTPGEAIYGEIVGDGIQKNYHYGCGSKEHKFFVYDVMKDSRWLNYQELVTYCRVNNLSLVPVLYVGPYQTEKVGKHRFGESFIGGQKVREGIVIKSLQEISCIIGRKVLKWVSEEYLLSDQTDFH